MINKLEFNVLILGSNTSDVKTSRNRYPREPQGWTHSRTQHNNKSFTLRLHDHKGITVLQEPLSIAKATGLLNF